VPDLDGPPANPEDWTDEQWIAWLEATDSEVPDAEPAQPVTRGARVVRSTGGVVLGAAMTGLAEIFQESQEPEIVVVAEGPDQADEDADFTVTLHPDASGPSVVRVRGRYRGNPSPAAEDGPADDA
jgi:hypothetical protein